MMKVDIGKNINCKSLIKYKIFLNECGNIWKQ